MDKRDIQVKGLGEVLRLLSEGKMVKLKTLDCDHVFPHEKSDRNVFGFAEKSNSTETKIIAWCKGNKIEYYQPDPYSFVLRKEVENELMIPVVPEADERIPKYVKLPHPMSYKIWMDYGASVRGLIKGIYLKGTIFYD